MGEHRRSPSPPARGQHFLRDARLCAELVRNAGVTRADLVVDIGAGYGALTSELVRRAGRVIAIEADPRLAARLRARFPTVDVRHADATSVELPPTPYRVVANLPFAHTTPILRRLLAAGGALLRADVVVAWGWAVKRCSQRPSTLLGLSWAPWFELTVTRRLAPSCFAPPPSVAAAVVTVTRRPDPLLDPHEQAAFIGFLRERFGSCPGATDLDAADWTERFRRTRGDRRRRRRGSGGSRVPMRP